VWGVPALRQDIGALENLLIDLPGGGHVRMGQVADVRLASSPEVISRDSVARYVDVVANLQGRDASSAVRDLESRLSAVQFDLEYRAEILGDALRAESEQLRLLGVVVAAIVGIFLLLQAAVQGWKLAALALVALPVATLGGIGVALVTDQLLTLGGLAGLLAVLGIAARNALALLMRYRWLEQKRGVAPSRQLAMVGGHERLTPTIVTAAATALAMAPFIVLGDLPGLEIVRPMAIVILGGLVSSTLVTLFLMPMLYLNSGPTSESERVRSEIEVPSADVQQPAGAA